MSDNIKWVSAHHVAEQITESIKREFKSSRPSPRPWKMGLETERKPHRFRNTRPSIANAASLLQ